MNSGIYQIRNVIDDNIYLGRTVNFKKRWNQHRHDLQKNCHSNRYLQNAWNKHGEENFVFEVLERFSNKSFLIRLEQYYIDNLEPEYNMCPTAGGGDTISIHPNNKEIRIKISKALKGKQKAVEHRKKQSKTCSDGRRKGKNNPMYGVHRYGKDAPNYKHKIKEKL